MRHSTLIPEFVEGIPAELEEGHLYISIRYRTASHLCACGCGLKVVTPIKPPKWHLTYDGETVSLWPSIGRWQLPCRSHYVIRKNRVMWAKQWSEKRIQQGREEDAEDLRHYYRVRAHETSAAPASEHQKAKPDSDSGEPPSTRRSSFSWLWRRKDR